MILTPLIVSPIGKSLSSIVTNLLGTDEDRGGEMDRVGRFEMELAAHVTCERGYLPRDLHKRGGVWVVKGSEDVCLFRRVRWVLIAAAEHFGEQERGHEQVDLIGIGLVEKIAAWRYDSLAGIAFRPVSKTR